MAYKDPDFCSKARENVRSWDDYWHQNILAYYENMEFVLGNQWIDEQSKVFERYNKVPLTANKLAPLANYMLGENIQNTPNIAVEPGDNVDEETAETREALVKDISFNSDSATKYQTCFEQLLIGSFSGAHVRADYANEYNFEQQIFVDDFKDAAKCFWDIGAENKAKTLGRFGGFRTRMRRASVREKWGKKVEGSIGADANNDEPTAFATDESITIIHYYERKGKRRKIYQLSTAQGDIVDDKELDSLERIQIDDKELLLYRGEAATIVNERTVMEYTVKYYQIAGDYILEERECPCKRIPVVFIDQKSYYNKSGKQITRSFFKDAFDSQKYINYLRTQAAYILKVSRYDQFLASKANVKSPDTQAAFKDPAIVRGALIYDESPSGSKPEKLEPPELSRSLQEQYQVALMDIQSSTGIYSTQLGDQGNEISGAAVDARSTRSSYNIQVPQNSLKQGITECAVIINEMIPKIYDTQRSVKLKMKDQNQQDVILNEQMDDYGGNVRNDMTRGDYKIRLVAGPSFEGQKQLGLESLERIFAADKTGNAFNLLGDLYAENLPLSNTIEIRNRIRATINPAIIQAGKTGKPLPPQPQQPDPAAMANMMKEQNRQQELQIKLAEVQQKERELQMKGAESQQNYAADMAKLQHQQNELQAEIEESKMRFVAELHRTNVDATLSHADNATTILTHHMKNLQTKEKANGK